MVRLNDIDDGLRAALEGLECRSYDTKPWIGGPPLNQRRVAIISTAGLQKRGDRPFAIGSDDYRVVPGDTDSGDIVMSHVSTNFDRTGFQQDINVAFPIDRLRELADDGVIGSVADFHYSFMGATDPDNMAPKAQELAGLLKKDNVDAVLLAPV
ncbi:MAG: selenoprotein B glycine/betaine/sarcosine/D-proline reductase [Rhodospirillales bacterium]|nr:selenoprotein B glycine/betaine/sarcosine/D-proline reductase [Rhodospirillales bacterium]